MVGNLVANIIVIEDEIEIRELIALHLLRQGYQVTECENIHQARLSILERKYDLVLVDWMLPGGSGVEFIKEIRKSGNETRVLMVTARVEAVDIVAGLEAGADDYLTKPFDPVVLLARVKALIRRSQQDKKSSNHDQIIINGLNINFQTYEVNLKGEKLHLTPSEFKLLSVMVQNTGRVLTRDHLIENIQGEGVNVIGRTIDTHVFGLRKKLGDWGDQIETIRGVGYRVKMDSN